MSNLFDELLDELREDVDRTIQELQAAARLEAGQRALYRLRAIADEEAGLKQSLNAILVEKKELEATLRGAFAAAKTEAKAVLRANPTADPKTVLAEATEPLMPLRDSLDRLTAAQADLDRQVDALGTEKHDLTTTPGLAEAQHLAAAEARRVADAAEHEAKLQHLKANFGVPKNWKDSSVISETLAPFLDDLGPPVALNVDSAEAEMKRIERAVSKTRVWTTWPTSIQHDVLALVTCRLAYAKTLLPGTEPRFKVLFGKLTQFRRDHDTAFVNGLTSAHKPKGKSWLDDAYEFWQLLEGSAAPPASASKKKATPAPAALDPAGQRESVESVTRRAAGQFAATLVFSDKAMQSAADSPYGQPEKVMRAFEAMDAVCGVRREAKANGTSMGALAAAFKQFGFEYKAHESEVTKGKWSAEYQMIYEGQPVSIEQHLALGAGTPMTCLRIHFWTDDDKMQFVIDHVGRHKTNTKT